MLDWLDVLPDMRISGVQGVQGVLPQKTAGFECTPPGVQGCACTPAEIAAHPLHTRAHPMHTYSEPQKTAENSHSTPCTPCTPNFWHNLTAKPGQVAEWASRLRDRAAGPPPSSVTLERWEQALGDAAGFLKTWGVQPVAMGWTERDLFAVPPGPDRWLNRAGLIALLRGRSVLAVAADTIAIGNPRGRPHHFRRRGEYLGAVMLWDREAYSQNRGISDGRL